MRMEIWMDRAHVHVRIPHLIIYLLMMWYFAGHARASFAHKTTLKLSSMGGACLDTPPLDGASLGSGCRVTCEDDYNYGFEYGYRRA
jgi:hypothetical protein